MTISKKEAQPQKPLDSQPVFYVGHSPETTEAELEAARGQSGMTLEHISPESKLFVCLCVYFCNPAEIETSK